MADASCVANGALRMATAGMSEMGLQPQLRRPGNRRRGWLLCFAEDRRAHQRHVRYREPLRGIRRGSQRNRRSLGNDISGSSPRSIRGEASNPGAADCLVELDVGGHVNVWIHGELGAIPVGATSGTLTAAFSRSTDSQPPALFPWICILMASISPRPTAFLFIGMRRMPIISRSAPAPPHVRNLDNFGPCKLPIADAPSSSSTARQWIDGRQIPPPPTPTSTTWTTALNGLLPRIPA